jgi:aquaporin Z
MQVTLDPRIETKARKGGLHWPEYLIEAGGLGAFMVSACLVTVLLEHPSSEIHRSLDCAFLRRAVAGVAMGLTALGLTTSPWGQRSGAHMNPAVTITYWMLGKVAGVDAAFYVLAQFAGGLTGVLVSSLLIGPALAEGSVNFAATVPGPDGPWIALVGELLISGVLMFAVLTASNSGRLARRTPFIVATLIALYISFEAPLSGMSMNPARTVASAPWGPTWTSLWIYFVAPLVGMLTAAAIFSGRVHCAKLDHANDQPCIFHCKFGELNAR